MFLLHGKTYTLVNRYNVDSFVVWFPIETSFIIYVNTKLNSDTTA